MQIDILLAKSCDEINKGERVPTYARLLPHLRAVQSAGEGIIAAVGELILQQLGLPHEPWLSRLQRALPVACLCHDVGKANESFQRMVRGELSPKLQPARHELLSTLLLTDKNNNVREWALQLLNKDGKQTDAEDLLECIIGAVGGHHLKLDEQWEKASIAFREGGCGTDLQMLITHTDLKSLFGEVINKEVRFDLTGNKENSLKDKYLPFKILSNRFKDKLKKEPEWWRFAAALKALTSAADVAGSALLPEKVSPKKWAQEALDKRHFVTAEKMHEVVKARLQDKTLRPFQEAIGQSEGRVTLVEAGCGSGKTAAAYLWAARHAHGKKLFFCYPTTGTATEGFLGYVAETDVEAELIHSRRIVDLEGLAKVKGDEEEGDHFLRVESLNAWTPQVVVCTADTVLALVRNNRRGWYNSPAILSASFVFDELHSYEDRMFAAVIALIKALPGASFLLMTASLPKARKDFLLKHTAVSEVPNPQNLDGIRRYEFEQLDSFERAFEIARESVKADLKVLWICNTVKQAQNIFESLKLSDLPVHTYHSRFKYEDRKKQHRKVIDDFNPENSNEGLIAVTTQVAEMSLDLDADVLISEVSPVPALIQRLGRLNRRVSEDNHGQPRTAYFLMPEKHSPYGKNEQEGKRIFEQAQRWLDELTNLKRPLSQADLVECFNALTPIEEQRLELKTEWLDSGWFAYPAPIRDAGFSVSVILPEDEKACQADRKQLIRKEIPMNFHQRMQDWREHKGRLIAPLNAIDYNKERGARWL